MKRLLLVLVLLLCCTGCYNRLPDEGRYAVWELKSNNRVDYYDKHTGEYQFSRRTSPVYKDYNG